MKGNLSYYTLPLYPTLNQVHFFQLVFSVSERGKEFERGLLPLSLTHSLWKTV